MHRGWCTGDEAPGVMLWGWCTRDDARSKVYLSKVYFCEMYPTCVSSKLCEFISTNGSLILFLRYPPTNKKTNQGVARTHARWSYLLLLDQICQNNGGPPSEFLWIDHWFWSYELLARARKALRACTRTQGVKQSGWDVIRPKWPKNASPFSSIFFVWPLYG